VIDTATNMVVATVPMGDDPRKVLTGKKPVTPRTLATPDALGLKTRSGGAKRLRGRNHCCAYGHLKRR
jgi:hypothetical protein